MFKLIPVIALTFLAIQSVVADPIRQKPLSRSILARQQVQPTAPPNGYPAAGVTPETPFDLPNETENPHDAQPDEVYGPPQADAQQSVGEEIQPDEVYGPPEAEVQQPDEIYGPPETEADTVLREILEDAAEELEDVEEVVIDEEDDDGAVISISSTFEKPARLVYQRFPQSRRPPTAVPARLTIVQPAQFLYTARL